MFVIDINPNNFFKGIGLEKDMVFHKSLFGNEKRKISLWINKEKDWDLYLYRSVSNKNQKGEILRVEAGTLVKVIWFNNEIPQGKIKDNPLFGGPAQLKIYPKIPNLTSKRINDSFFKKTSSSDNLKIIPFPSELLINPFGFPEGKINKKPEGVTSHHSSNLSKEQKSMKSKKMEIYSSKKKKAHQSTKNIFFMSHLKDIVQGHKYKVFISLRGIGQRAFLSEDNKYLNFKLGQTHPIHVKIPSGIKATTSTDRSATIGGGDNQFLKLESPSKEKVSQFANLLVTLRPPEPQKGKGLLIRSKKEDLRRQLLRKQGRRKAALSTITFDIKITPFGFLIYYPTQGKDPNPFREEKEQQG